MSGARGQAVPSAGESTGGGSISAILPGYLNAAVNDITANWLRISEHFDLDSSASVYFVAKGAPTNLRIDIKKSTNNGSSFSSVLSSVLIFTSGVQHIVPNWTGGDLSVGDLLRLDVTVGDAACHDVFLQILHNG